MKPRQAHALIKKIRNRYPKAGVDTSDDNTRAPYCAGGAFCHYEELNWLNRLVPFFDEGPKSGWLFPDADIIAAALVRINPALTTHMSFNEVEDIADAVIMANDAGDIHDAYRLLEYALAFPITKEQLNSLVASSHECNSDACINEYNNPKANYAYVGR